MRWPNQHDTTLVLSACIAVVTLHAANVKAQTRFLDRLLDQVEPSHEGQPEKLSYYLDAYKHTFGNDPRLFCFEVAATIQANGVIRLTGSAEITEMRVSLVKYLQRLGFSVIDAVDTLPSTELGERTLGIVNSTHTLSYDKPSGQRDVVTDCLLGDRLYLLREVDGHFLAHSDEGYLGYVAASDIVRMAPDDFDQYLADPSIRITTQHTTASGLILPVGARLKLGSVDGDTLVARLPTGDSVTLPRSVCRIHSAAAKQIDQVIQRGRSFLGTMYFWGGKTNTGIDCSGLVQVSFNSVGINLPRDSNQQFLLGTLTGTRWHRTGMRRGDTLYFLGPHGRIRHTAIYLGDDRYLQAEMPTVDIRSLNPEHDDYDARRAKSFAFAKRLLD